MVKILIEKMDVLISGNKGSGVAKIQSKQLAPYIGTRLKVTIEAKI